MPIEISMAVTKEGVQIHGAAVGGLSEGDLAALFRTYAALQRLGYMTVGGQELYSAPSDDQVFQAFFASTMQGVMGNVERHVAQEKADALAATLAVEMPSISITPFVPEVAPPAM